MKKILLSALLLVLVIPVFTMTGCGISAAAQIQGEWHGVSESRQTQAIIWFDPVERAIPDWRFNFNPDGTFTNGVYGTTQHAGTWQIRGRNLTITMPETTVAGMFPPGVWELRVTHGDDQTTLVGDFAVFLGLRTRLTIVMERTSVEE